MSVNVECDFTFLDASFCFVSVEIGINTALGPSAKTGIGWNVQLTGYSCC